MREREAGRGYIALGHGWVGNLAEPTEQEDHGDEQPPNGGGEAGEQGHGFHLLSKKNWRRLAAITSYAASA
jgi:hypothetical protein